MCTQRFFSLLWLAAVAVMLPSCTQQQQPAAIDAHPTVAVVGGYLPERLCYVDELIPELEVDLMYAGSDNFVGRPIKGYTGRRAVLRRDVTLALRGAVRELASRGYRVVLRDAYRPHRALADIAAWSRSSDTAMKQKYYPRIAKSQIRGDQYIGDISEHSYGIAVDITLRDAATGALADMGGPVDFLDPSSATDYRGADISTEAMQNRAMLRQVMRRHGFKNYEKEWWHFWLTQAPQPVYSYDFPLDDALKVRP